MDDSPYLTTELELTNDEINSINEFISCMQSNGKDNRTFKAEERSAERYRADQFLGKAGEVGLARFLRRGGILTARANMDIFNGDDGGMDLVGVPLKIEVKGTKSAGGKLMVDCITRSNLFVLFQVVGSKIKYKGHAGRGADWLILNRGDFIPNTNCRIKAEVQYCLTQDKLIVDLPEMVTKIKGMINKC